MSSLPQPTTATSFTSGYKELFLIKPYLKSRYINNHRHHNDYNGNYKNLNLSHSYSPASMQTGLQFNTENMSFISTCDIHTRSVRCDYSQLLSLRGGFTTASKTIPTNSLDSHSSTIQNSTTNSTTTQTLVDKTQHQEDLTIESHPTNPRLMVLIKLLFLTYYGSLGALMPYLPVYYHSLGHSGQAIGLLGAVKPLTTFIISPIWGILSDYYQNPKLHPPTHLHFIAHSTITPSTPR
jgi:hypothetical protein